MRTEAVALFALPVKPGKFNFPFLPGRDSLRVLEVVRGYQVCREVKHRPLQSHGPLLSPDVFGDGVKGAKGGNPDPLQVEEEGRALRAGWRKSPYGGPTQGRS